MRFNACETPPDEEDDHPGSVAVSFAAVQSATPVPAPKQQTKPQAQSFNELPKASAPEPPKTVDEYLQVMSVDQAKMVKIDFGKFSGWTLGDIAMKSPGDLAWYVKNYSGHNLALKAGAIKLLEAAGQMAS